MKDHAVAYGTGHNFPDAVLELEETMDSMSGDGYEIHGSIQVSFFPEHFGSYSVCLSVLMIRERITEDD